MTDIPIESQRAVVHLVRTWWDDSYAHNMAEAGNDDVVREDFQDTYPRLVEAGFVYGPVAARAALQSLRERVEGLPHGSSCALVVMNVGGCDCHLAAVLRLVDEALE
jgi:hypothetical protein